jgi:hypothetical protein
MPAANRAAAKNVEYRGAAGLHRHLRGLIVPARLHPTEDPLHVIDLPASLDYRALGRRPRRRRAANGKALFDARHVRLVDPCGMVGPCSPPARGCAIAARVRRRASSCPTSADVLGYMARMGLVAAAAGVFEMDGTAPRRFGRRLRRAARDHAASPPTRTCTTLSIGCRAGRCRSSRARCATRPRRSCSSA